jgi:hypothetical protein
VVEVGFTERGSAGIAPEQQQCIALVSETWVKRTRPVVPSRPDGSPTGSTRPVSSACGPEAHA